MSQITDWLLRQIGRRIRPNPLRLPIRCGKKPHFEMGGVAPAMRHSLFIAEIDLPIDPLARGQYCAGSRYIGRLRGIDPSAIPSLPSRFGFQAIGGLFSYPDRKFPRKRGRRLIESERIGETFSDGQRLRRRAERGIGTYDE